MTGVGAESWVAGDVVLAADGGLWVRAAAHDVAQGWPWAYCHGDAPQTGRTPPPEGAVEEGYPVRPLVLLIREGRPCPIRVPGGCCVGERWGDATQTGHGDLLMGHSDTCPVSPGKFEELNIEPDRNTDQTGAGS